MWAVTSCRNIGWHAKQATLVFYAGSTTCKLAPTTKTGREAATLQAYNNAIADLDKSQFNSNAILFFRQSFRDKEKPMTGYALYRYYLDSRSAMRSTIIPLFPTNFNEMKSGRGFHESVNAAFTNMYRKELTTRVKDRMTQEEADQETPPMFWEYKEKPWYFGLAVKVYRRDLQLAPITNDVAEDPSNAPVCRAVLKRHKQYKSHGTCMEMKKMSGTKKLGVPANEVLVIDVDAEEEKEHKKKRKTSLFAANVMTSNLTIRMGQMQELKEALNFLDRMRPIIGDEEYAKLAKKYLSFLPDPATFTNEVTSSKDLAMAIKKEPMDEEEEGENDDEDDVELL
ncbi:hypothetical protein MHU86_264 [Fragilaria crotonensis]|nr:hypothetical protein MHU86_264 [Fragilaria crotonensis]